MAIKNREKKKKKSENQVEIFIYNKQRRIALIIK